MSEVLGLLAAAALVNNFVLVQFLGLCPFIGTSSRIETAVPMSLATMFVISITTLLAHLMRDPALADTGTARYAIVVGSNPGDDGQQALRYAEQDARNFAAVLQDMGGYAKADIELLAHPSAKQLRRAVARVSEKISLDAGAGRQTLLVFYYSGHARAKSLNLGGEEVDLESLRTSLEELPATLKVVILEFNSHPARIVPENIEVING